MTELLTGYQFYLELDGITEALFRECSGLSTENQVIESYQAPLDRIFPQSLHRSFRANTK